MSLMFWDRCSANSLEMPFSYIWALTESQKRLQNINSSFLIVYNLCAKILKKYLNAILFWLVEVKLLQRNEQFFRLPHLMIKFAAENDVNHASEVQIKKVLIVL